MESFLQLIGSVASIASVPLAVYFFLRQREAKHYRLRQEICRALSYQIGEGRALSQFEVYSVIESKCREHRANADEISQEEVVEDLVVETITNPMLDSKRKEGILQDLRMLHAFARTLDVLTKHIVPGVGILKLASEQLDLTHDEHEILDREDTKLRASAVRHEGVLDNFSNIFALIAGIMTGLAVTVTASEQLREFVGKIITINGPLLTMSSGFLVGVVSSIVAAIISFLYVKWKSDLQEKPKKKRKGEAKR